MAKLLSSVVLLLLVVMPTAALGKLAQTDFDSLVKESDLILIAEPLSIYQQNSGAGYAEMKVLEVLKGSKIKQIRIEWSSEVHDTKISGFAWHVLFLRQEGGQYVATYYGRGAWPVGSAWFKTGTGKLDWDCCKHYVEYVYPVDHVKFKDGVVKRMVEHEEWRDKSYPCEAGKKAEGILLDELKGLIAALAARG